jgi:hypothetical protein
LTALHGISLAYALLPADGVAKGIKYLLTLTGAENSTTDIQLPAYSVRAGLYSGSPSYLSAVIPYSTEFLEAVIARPDGQLILIRAFVFGDDSEAVNEVSRFNFDDFSYSIGARNRSITLSGSKQTTNSAPGVIQLTSADLAEIRLQANGDYLLSLSPNRASPRAADTLVYDGVNYLLSRVDYSISPSFHTLTATGSAI